MSISACFLLSPFAAHAAAQTHDYDTKDTHTTHRSPSPLLQHPDRNGSTSADAIAPRTSLNGLAGRIRAPFPQARVALAIADEAWQYIYSPPFRGKRRGANPGPQSTFLPTRIMRSIPSVSPVHQHDKPHSWARLTAGNHAAFRTERRSSPKAETEGKNGASFACADSTFEEGGIRHVRALLLRYLVGGVLGAVGAESSASSPLFFVQRLGRWM